MSKNTVGENKTTIFIPTRGRSEKQKTLQCIPKKFLKNTVLVVHASEMELHKKYEDTVKVVPLEYNTLSEKKQLIMEMVSTKYAIIVDDDLTFHARKEGKLVVADDSDVCSMFELLEFWLEGGIAHVGVSARGGNNHVESSYLEVTRICLLCGLNVEVFRKEGVRFDRVPTMQDFDCTLSLLGKGYKNRVSYNYACGHTSGSKGGCSLYRNEKTQKESILFLKENFPYCVKILKKTSGDSWEGFESQSRTDVNILWNKAYIPKISKNNLGKFFLCHL